MTAIFVPRALTGAGAMLVHLLPAPRWSTARLLMCSVMVAALPLLPGHARAEPTPAASAPATAQTTSANPIQIKVKRTHGKLIIDVAMSVPVRQGLAFEVMTDYAHMPAFISNVKDSKINKTEGNKLQVSQSGKASNGILSFSYEAVREVTLAAPNDIQSRIIGGSIKQGESITHFSTEGQQTKITMHSESTVSVLLPPVIGVSFVEGQLKKQYQEYRDEMLRRQKLADATSVPAVPSAPLLAK